MMKIDIDLRCEFSYEFVLGVPYCYYLHTIGQLGSVTTSKDMRCFYYFCDDVREIYTSRSVNNSTNGLSSIPNDWIHHNIKKIAPHIISDPLPPQFNGVLDYSEWLAPPYKTVYANDVIPKNVVFIANKYNHEWGSKPVNFIDFYTLYELFEYLSSRGYTIIYKRLLQNDAPVDENEFESLNISGKVEFESGVESITDHQLCDYFPNVLKIQDISKNLGKSINETQLMIGAQCDKFITIQGGNSHLSGFFGENINLVFRGNELRPGYFTNPGNWYSKLGGNKSYPITIVKSYTELLETVKAKYQ